jgi:hypothetical protein
MIQGFVALAKIKEIKNNKKDFIKLTLTILGIKLN